MASAPRGIFMIWIYLGIWIYWLVFNYQSCNFNLPPDFLLNSNVYLPLNWNLGKLLSVNWNLGTLEFARRRRKKVFLGKLKFARRRRFFCKLKLVGSRCRLPDFPTDMSFNFPCPKVAFYRLFFYRDIEINAPSIKRTPVFWEIRQKLAPKQVLNFRFQE